ncbi:tetratricopeptide repeat protein [Vibrio algicola]|uniref:Tetratricopeptide repeat protein n=1 Tax=Vibrio algicola TaxID=2662262 RepID=A0A5Q0TGL9_9VIBR|nr:tetratricopeptide repeat protein [Vibrio algicola]
MNRLAQSLMVLSFLLSSLLFSTLAQAKVYLSPVAQEAERLLSVNPQKSLEVTKQFLATRKLVATNSQDYTLSKDGSENSIRTPATSIEALQIMALAYQHSNQPQQALLTIRNAESIAQHYQLPQPLLDSQLIQSQLLWQQNHNISSINQKITQIKNQLQQEAQATNWKQEFHYNLYMFEAKIYAYQGDTIKAEAAFKQAENYVIALKSTLLTIDYHLTLGQYYLEQSEYDDSLTQLLITYWMAVKEGDSIELAKANLLLAKLFYTRQVFDKAIEHTTEAADFYDNYPYSEALSDTLKLMADTYFQQGKYNLALVNYLNVLDNETALKKPEKIIDLKINIANTYLKLFDFSHAEIYLTQTIAMVKSSGYSGRDAEIYLLQAALALSNNDASAALNSSQHALTIANKIRNNRLKMDAYNIRSSAYQQQGNYQQAFKTQKHYQALWKNQQEQFNAINDEVFRQQKDIIEQSLHYAGLEDNLARSQQQYSEYQKSTFILLFVCFLMLALIIYRGSVNTKIRADLEEQTLELYTHTRSRLQNLKLLNVKLPKSLQRSSAVFEQWRLGELINEPLIDRLYFVMFDVTFLRNVYLKRGYQAGLEIEQAFGAHLKTFVTAPARLYHFADGRFLYIEPKATHQGSAKEMFEKINSWVEGFQTDTDIKRHIRMGMAEYPFLPKAYTAINDKELIDILLMAIYIGRQMSKHEGETKSQWIHLSAIKNAPAASFASDNTRLACQQAVNQGLIKIQTLSGNDELAKEIIRNEKPDF